MSKKTQYRAIVTFTDWSFKSSGKTVQVKSFWGYDREYAECEARVIIQRMKEQACYFSVMSTEIVEKQK